jgi:two-component system, NtrC family, sensor histidine kinase HydH
MARVEGSEGDTWPPRLIRPADPEAMFRVQDNERDALIPTTAVIVLGTLLLALVLSAAAVYQVLAEYRLLGTWLVQPGGARAAAIQALRQDIGTRIIIRSSALILLLLCAGATLWLQQRQLAVRRTLDHLTLLARDILASVDQGVITIDLQNRITGINLAATAILGVEVRCIGQPLARLGAGGGPLVALADRVADRQAAVWDHDFAVERSGRVRRVRADAHVLKDRTGRALGCVLLLRDMSERLLMEERVRRMERFLSLGTLASGLHHEIKNPLTALSIHIQLLEKRLREPAPRRPVEELLGVVKTEILRLNGVLESFRDFASLQRLNLQPADPSLLLHDLARLIRPQADQQHVEVVLRHAAEGSPRVPLDIEKFKQAVLNLMINALEAMAEGGKLVVEMTTQDGELHVAVSDTGPGIPPEIHPSLFKPYFSTKTRGTGMGLALTEKLVGQHGGRIDFRTSPRGTTFRIAIPLEPPIEARGQT